MKIVGLFGSDNKAIVTNYLMKRHKFVITTYRINASDAKSRLRIHSDINCIKKMNDRRKEVNMLLFGDTQGDVDYINQHGLSLNIKRDPDCICTLNAKVTIYDNSSKKRLYLIIGEIIASYDALLEPRFKYVVSEKP